MKKILITLSLFSFLSFGGYSQEVELHSHAFMKHGLTFLFRGDFNSPLKAKSWKNLLSSKLNAETLNKSGIKIFVVALYAHPFLVPRLKVSPKKWVRESIRAQVKEARSFVKNNPNWVLATNPTEALKAYQEGKKIMILSVEGAHSLLETEKDLKEFIDELGISIVTVVHLIDTKFGGAAYMRGLRKTLFSSRICAREIIEGVKVNSKGITEKGLWLSKELIKRKVWIDLTHSSDHFQKDIIPLLEKAGQPLLYTHTALREYYKAERGLSKWAIKEMKRLGGIVGLVPSEEMLIDTPVPSKHCPKTCHKCEGGIPALVTQYNQLAIEIGPSNISLGSDFNGGITHLRPSKCSHLTSLDNKKGLWSAAQYPEIWQAMKKLNATLPSSPSESSLQFLKSWQKVRN